MWFGPRLGKRTIAADLHDDLVEEFDAEPLGYAGEPPQKLATELVQGAPYMVLLVTAKPRKCGKAFHGPIQNLNVCVFVWVLFRKATAHFLPHHVASARPARFGR